MCRDDSTVNIDVAITIIVAKIDCHQQQQQQQQTVADSRVGATAPPRIDWMHLKTSKIRLCSIFA